jgi:hypothetical protein
LGRLSRFGSVKLLAGSAPMIITPTIIVVWTLVDGQIIIGILL